MSNRLYKKVLIASMVAIPALISGCASNLGVGNSDFGCDGMPEGVQCMSARQVYELTDTPGALRADPYAHIEDDGKSAAEARRNVEQRLADRSGNASTPFAQQPQPRGDLLNASPIHHNPVPVRTQPGIMRIWVAPWESTDGDLHVSGQIFTEIETRRWNIGTPEVQNREGAGRFSVRKAD